MNIEVILENIYKNIIRITDVTKESYIPEDLVESKYSSRYFNYKYSDTCTINIIYYYSLQGEEIIDTVYTPHCSKLDEIEFKLPKDGHYEVVHIILPTVEWLASKITDEKFDLSTYREIYVTDGTKVYKYFNKDLVECDISEVAMVNSDKTTISRCYKEFFCIWFLQNCYINLSKEIFNSILSKCTNNIDTFNRDFIWMTLNVINYYVEFNQLNEAQRVLEDVNGCNGFCKNTVYNKKISNCGCNR